jgi:uncharacterized protein (DUF342 family)
MVPNRDSGRRGDPNGPELSVCISRNRHEAFLLLKGPREGKKLDENEVKEFLAKHGVVYGLNTEAIHAFCEGGASEVLCARGLLPQDEKEAELQYFFRTDVGVAPTQREDGSVNFDDLGIVQNVKKGDILCRIVPPEPGKDGIDVMGKPVPHTKVKLPSFPSGHNTIVSEDGLELSAAIDGCIEYHKNSLSVSENFYVRGDVDGSSGNIDFIGTVIVEGDVTEGYTVKAGGDITVHGMVRGATLKADGNITVSHGVNGMRGGSLTAGGNVTARYFQNATVTCACDLFTDVLMNCNVQAGHSIILRGPNASIMGGKCRAGQQICAKVIGTPNNVRTDVGVDSHELHDAMAGPAARAGQIAELKGKIADCERTAANASGQLETVHKAIGQKVHSRQTELLLQALTQRMQSAQTEAKQYRERLEELQNAPEASTLDFTIVGLKTIYAGTKITIGSYSKNLTNDYSKTKFYFLKDDIIPGPVLPSDEKDY